MSLLTGEPTPGGWYDSVIRARAVLQESDDPTPVHVLPPFGRDHALSAGCWCGPRADMVDRRIYVHVASN